jgi:hypothetical protein
MRGGMKPKVSNIIKDVLNGLADVFNGLANAFNGLANAFNWLADASLASRLAGEAGLPG